MYSLDHGRKLFSQHCEGLQEEKRRGGAKKRGGTKSKEEWSKDKEGVEQRQRRGGAKTKWRRSNLHPFNIKVFKYSKGKKT